MARPLLHYLSAALLGFSGMGAAAGCADTESMLVIRGVIALQPPQCIASPDATLFHLAGSVDTRLSRQYVAHLQVANQLMARGDDEQLRSETARVTITGAEVVLTRPDGSRIGRGNYTVTASGSIDPSVGNQPGLGVVFAPLVPDFEQYIDVDDAPNPLIVEVQVYGKTLGGQEVWSNWYTYPIYFTRLVTFPAESLDETTGRCTPAGASEPPCIIGQDDAVPCSACLQESFCEAP